MQNDVSKFVVNIVPLQNIQSNASGINETTNLAKNVIALQQMVNTNTKTIYTNNIASFTSNTAIQILSPMNLSNVGITSNDSAVTGQSGSQLQKNTTFLTLNDGTPTLTLSVGANTLFTCTQAGQLEAASGMFATRFVETTTNTDLVARITALENALRANGIPF